MCIQCDPQFNFLLPPAGISGGVKVRETEMLTAGGEHTSSSEVSRSRLPKGKDLTADCEVEAFPRSLLSLEEVGGLSQPGWVNGHGPCGIWPFGKRKSLYCCSEDLLVLYGKT